MITPRDSVEISENSNNQQAGSNTSSSVNKLDMSAMINDMLALKDVLEKETNWLKTMQLSKVNEVHDEKIKLIRKLEIQKELITRHPELMSAYNAEEKRYIRDLEKVVNAVVKENFFEVLKAREVNQRLVQVISNEVERQTTAPSGYSRYGTAYGTNGQVAAGGSYAMALNKTV